MDNMNLNQPFQRAMTLAALSGLKMTLGPAFHQTSHRKPNAKYWVMAAIGEMILDKVGVFPARFNPMVLIPHTIAGAWVAHESLKEDGVDDHTQVAMAAVVAAGTACVAPMIRIAASKVLRIPDPLLGLAEDYLALHLGTQAMGMTMDQVSHAAQDAVGDITEGVRPALESVGIGG